jgi:O-antigen/teichoic acid export membrane protein
MNSISFGFLFISNLFLLPYIVHSLGNEYFGGIWVIVGALTAYMGLVDLGIGMSFIKFISEYYTKGEESSMLEVVNTGIAVYAVVGMILLLSTWLLGEVILRLVGVPESIMVDAVFVLRVAILVLLISNLMSPVTSVLTGLQRMDINAYISIVGQLLNIFGTIAVLSAGFGIRGLILNSLAITVINCSCLAWFAFRLVPALKLGLRYCRKAMVKKFLGYGANLQVSKLAQIILFQTDRILALRLFGQNVATYYDIGARLSNTARSITSLSISALVPAVAELDARQHHDAIMMLYKRGSKYVAVTATFLFVFLCAFAPQIVRLWMGEQYLAAASVVRLLVVGYYLNIITGVASSLAAGLGKTEFERRYGIFTSVFNIVAIVGLSLLLGPNGIALGTSLSLMVGGTYFLWLFHKFLKIEPREILAIFGRPLLTGLIGGSVTVLVAWMWPASQGITTKEVVQLGVEFVVYCFLFLAALRVLGVFDDYDRQMIRSMVRGFRSPA